MNRTRIQIAKPDILAFFSEVMPPILRERQIASALAQQRKGWRLAQSTTLTAFIEFLLKSGRLKRHKFDFPNRPETVYSWGTPPTMELLLHLKANSYFSHYTALRMHGLTEQVPKLVYISHERSTPPSTGDDITQAAIDKAFRQPARVSQNAVDFGELRIVLLNSANTGELGVVDQEHQQGEGPAAKVRVTSIERTLIDAAVRPTYCGGVAEVAKAFELARGAFSVNALGAMLSKMGFTYPYHQAIGFYLERAGYRDGVVDIIRRFPMKHDFYLTHDMADTRYESAWRLHVPKSF
ncbi:hypothetical protein OOZ63_09040 [Paucibacter sp. PLA-PC-4]|uniref:type IV toxin-antitoxin system AbiEi family antitoxin domain-containing protein n=1 Tax=Paucibacter sp. PLA-PC-4 TaxID=2993655 RepID=UPI002248CECB|nr:type IV toxin-antitoxin system AbiEi family antitoxin [Paucibacter sp. PLA-PC-4]MCX2861983.1 hypothetical protein [Paucibacter sp. PLA-PC-4]